MTIQRARLTLDAATGEGHDRLLRLALKLDAIASGALGLLGAVAAAPLERLLGIPAALLLPVGLALVAYAAVVWRTGTRSQVNRTAAWTIVGLNLLWVVESVAIVAAGWLSLTTLGLAFVLAQAGAVALFADLQFLGLRRAARA